MDFKQLEAFITVSKLKSFSKAANSIYLSQPTISSHISSLERELNVQLFDRTSKEVNLTPVGESFLQYANDIINIRNNAITDLADFNTTITGALNISASTTPCNSLLPNLVSSFSTLYSNVKFNIREQGSVSIIKDIMDLKCEIGLVGTIINNPKINSYKIMNDELVVASSPRLNFPEVISIEDLTKHPFIVREKESATRHTLEKQLHSHNIDMKKVKTLCEVDSVHAQLKFIKLGLGISIISKSLCEDYISNGTINISKVQGLDLNRDIFLVTSSKRTLTPIARAFFTMCKEIYKL
ncbi:MAG: selenium metabolism-associated LysR family transcriptional regulator [Clostridium sp.]|uniref:selenium metabolism-associated LysR family transcriptional regulator n=1 Tax=Clostridium sp. TaxID=1506 RepID=UPI00306308B3